MTVVDLLVVGGAAVVVVVLLVVLLVVVVVVVVVSEMRAIVIDYHEAFGQPRHGPSGRLILSDHYGPSLAVAK